MFWSIFSLGKPNHQIPLAEKGIPSLPFREGPRRWVALESPSFLIDDKVSPASIAYN